MRAKTTFFYSAIFGFFIQAVLVSGAAGVTRIMPLGDSITRGTCCDLPSDERVGYRQKLYLDLIDKGYDVDFVGSVQDGGSAVPFFDIDHEGHGAYTAAGIANEVLDWLSQVPGFVDIVLLHIGTIDLEPPPETTADNVESILEEIDTYDPNTWVILALIINRMDYLCPNFSSTTTFNENVLAMANARIAAGDKILIVDMECGAGIDYRDQLVGGDMWDNLHPFETGYAKMADVWFDGLEEILNPDPDPPNNPSSSDEEGSGCFIGTAAYGSDMEPHAKTPQEFPDPFKLTNIPGKVFMSLYYAIRRLRPVLSLDILTK